MRQPTVLVVDNDPDGGARETASQFGGGIAYVHEPTPGIAAARNRALAESVDFDLLVFIDDDERPTTGWLTSLLATRLRTGADGVVGPVVSTFAAPTRSLDRRRRFLRSQTPTHRHRSERGSDQ